MNSKLAKNTQQRIDVSYLSSLKLKGYGYNNLYPQDVSKIVASSATGSGCLDRYSKFIKGNGFSNTAFAEYIVNRSGDTMDDIQTAVSTDLAKFGGFAIHVNYNILGEIVELQHVPFEQCRLGEEDDAGFISEIVIHPDWTGMRTRNGKKLQVSTSTVERFPVFCPVREVVQAQILEAGGIENYKGQIMYVSTYGKNVYPLAKYDDVLTEMVTDEGLADLKNRDVTSGFYPAGVFIVRKGQSVDITDEDTDEDQEDSALSELESNFIQMQGAKNAQRAMFMALDPEDEKPEFVRIQGQNYDKVFESTEKSVTERIYAAFGQEAFYRIRSGSLGFSSDIIKDVYSLYASMVVDEQRCIERAFTRLFMYWHDKEANQTKDFSTQPLKYISVENTTKI